METEENAFSEIETMFGGNQLEKKIPIPVYGIILFVLGAVAILFIILLIIYLMKGGDSFKGKLPASSRGHSVNPGRMKQENSRPIFRYQGDANDGPRMPTLSDQVMQNMELDNLSNPTMLDYEYDAYYDSYKRANGSQGFIGSNESPEHADTINPAGHYPIHPIKPEFADQPTFHQNRLENILYDH